MGLTEVSHELEMTLLVQNTPKINKQTKSTLSTHTHLFYALL